MVRMGRNCLPEARHRALPRSVENRDWNREVSRSSTDASSLSAENCKDAFCCLAAVELDDRTAWTDEKHNMYIYHLEMLFVKQLHQSKRFLAQCSEQNQRENSISQKQFINVNNDSKQNGCWQKINCVKEDVLTRSNPVDSCTPFKGNWMHNLKHTYMHSPPPSAGMPEFPKLCSTAKHGKLIIIRHELAAEGVGQNFSDENNQSTSNYESRAKRSKTALADSSSHDDQIVPSWNCATPDSSG